MKRSEARELAFKTIYSKFFNAEHDFEIEEKADSPLTNRLCLIYNKFSNKTSTALNDIGIKNIGGAPRYEHATTAQVLEQLCTKEMFDKIV